MGAEGKKAVIAGHHENVFTVGKGDLGMLWEGMAGGSDLVQVV